MDKKRHSRLALAILIIILSIIFGNYIVNAIPAYPVQIYGSISQYNRPVPDGLSVRFFKNSDLLASTVTNLGRFGYTEPVYIDGEFLSVGDRINIQIDGKNLFEVSYYGGADIGIDFDLPIDVPISTAISGAAIACEPSWKCSDWSSCINGIQTRFCTDVNKCGKDDGKPIEDKECGSVTITPVVTPPVVSTVPSTQPSTPVTSTSGSNVSSSGGSLSFLWYMIVILIVLGIIWYSVRLYNERHVPSTEPNRFVHLSLKEGHHEDTIKQKLVESGWQRSHVEDTIQIEKLRHYIIDELKKGVKREDLRKFLIDYGWQKDIVDDIMRTI